MNSSWETILWLPEVSSRSWGGMLRMVKHSEATRVTSLRLDRNCKPSRERLWLIWSQPRHTLETEDDVIVYYADNYLEFVHNSDRSLPLFTSILRVRLSILKHKYRVKLWSNTLQSGHSIWFDAQFPNGFRFFFLWYFIATILKTNGILSKLPTNMTNILTHTSAYRSCTVAVLGMISFQWKELLNQCIFAGL